MKYLINTKNYCTFETFEVNKLPGRTYFIPYPNRAQADAAAPKEKRYASEKVQCLNGVWDFKFYPRPAELAPVLDTEQIGTYCIEALTELFQTGRSNSYYTVDLHSISTEDLQGEAASSEGGAE